MNGLLIANHKTPMIVPFYGQTGMGKKGMHGKGWMDNLAKAGKFLKDTQLISNTMSLFPNEKAQAISAIAKQIGLGKKPKARKPRKQKGAGIFGDAFGGLGNLAYGIGAGGGALSRGLFGGRKAKKKMINM